MISTRLSISMTPHAAARSRPVINSLTTGDHVHRLPSAASPAPLILMHVQHFGAPDQYDHLNLASCCYSLIKPIHRSSRYRSSTSTLYLRCLQPEQVSAAGSDDHQRTSEFTDHPAPVGTVPEEDEDIEEEEEEDDGISRGTLLWRAVKLPMYTVALIPVTVGSSAAYLQTGIFDAWRYSRLLLSFVSVIAWLNLSNDVFDSETGVDKKKRESVVNIVGSRRGVFYAANAFLLVGLLGLYRCTCVEGGDLRSMALLVAGICCGYVYQGPPFRLSYLGLGEPLLFLFFGPLSTIGFYLSQRDTSTTSLLPLTSSVVSASVLVGLTTALILLCSHFHQIDDDRAGGKISPLVRLGTRKGAIFVKRFLILLYALLVLMVALKTLPFTCLLFCIPTVPMAKLVTDYVDQNHDKKSKIFMAKYYCVRLHTFFGAALSAGLVAAR